MAGFNEPKKTRKKTKKSKIILDARIGLPALHIATFSEYNGENQYDGAKKGDSGVKVQHHLR
jgi:hypothetical protein